MPIIGSEKKKTDVAPGAVAPKKTMAITIDGEEKRIGLALSGGGFRAACFHLGVMKKLDELGLSLDTGGA